MNLISVENLCKSFTEKVLFNNISFGINHGDKIGIIGVNGCGKSTLLKILTGEEEADGGTIIKSRELTIEYLPQVPVFNEENTAMDEIFQGSSKELKALKEYESTLLDIERNPEDPNLSNRLMEISAEIDALNAWDMESSAKTVLTRLGIKDFSKKIGQMSGGQKKRIALAAALIKPCTLLILDEPTNHMDNDTIAWLENYLQNRNGALLMITHDRYFLDRVSNKTIELSGGNLYSYHGNFSVFLEKRIEREAMEKSNEDKRQNLLRRELAWIKRGAKARTTKQKARIDRFNELNSVEVSNISSTMEISTAHSRLGNKIMNITDLSKTFNGKHIISNFSYVMCKDDRIGIIGANGMGKSTLLNIIAGKLKEDSGCVDIGDTVKLGYFCQSNFNMDENLRVIEYIKETAEFISTSEGDKISASQMLERFLFNESEQWTPIYKLSGGEKRRLYLLKVLMESPNVLLLDEPTNDLDISTLEVLEDYIENFTGPVMVVSHDRYFLDKITNKILSFEGHGEILYHTGNYSDYLDYKLLICKEKEGTMPQPSSSKSSPNSKDIQCSKKVLAEKPLKKLSYKDQREFDEIEHVISDIEDSICSLEDEINKNSTNYAKLQELLEKKSNAEKLLEEKMNRWEYLNELVEEINRNKELKN
ncbi:ATP-binding cassette, subfamily F, uup [Hathewaya proteolytica DSM 3090]|uniref:ATP-binding cassette, subfamily F, uup n=1 Tax=Hathewaya proteolytica DSM 3090 TaxID=1121331 RepID=A0A1M6RMM2_9CLOT|nr:ABC-F family ATP-binding cassette domain-containing protein [Hathewaya proteolytica]SHK33705.1 ATP-binding cassette, subfamily F, uup [Hathewaya proteolytica DSM 3090]